MCKIEIVLTSNCIQGDHGEGHPGPRGPPGPPGPTGPGFRSVSYSHFVLCWQDCLPSWIFCCLFLFCCISDFCGHGGFRVPRFGIYAGEEQILLRTVTNCVAEDTISVTFVGTTWHARPTWPSRSSWSLYSRHSIEFWGIWTTRKGRGAWSICRCQRIHLSAPLARKFSKWFEHWLEYSLAKSTTTSEPFFFFFLL